MAEQSPLIQIIRPSTRAQAVRAAHGRCDVCGAPIDDAHEHLVDLRLRAIQCACRACYLLFEHDGAGGGRLRAIPRRYARLRDADGARDSVDALDLPIGLAFLFRSSASGSVHAFYPSPAGAIESEVPLHAWEALVHAVPDLATLATDVEALLLRLEGERVEAFIVPIDASYELVGRIRRAWRGFTGGDELWSDIDAFFAAVATRADGDGEAPAAPAEPAEMSGGRRA